ncbi:AmmeMemoRadiSam system protein A [candidate division CSSED10-310 bacterium]|uniref:AmmeMemoRadiSam system protein A n=1 Tax=candidate division CSSED10-310 bacterium TaxID=2855610 RepID=A0ABV6YY65_UNCC1
MPFLQTVLKNFTIVPMLLGTSIGIEETLAKALAKNLVNKKILVLGSTDMTHYPSYNIAGDVDRQALAIIKTLDPDALRKFNVKTLSAGKPNLHCTFCGLKTVLTIMDYARRVEAQRVEILKYANSGDVPEGGKSRVVGYSAVLFINETGSGLEPGKEIISPTPAPVSNENTLRHEVGAELLRIARQTLHQYVLQKKIPAPTKTEAPYTTPGAVFVTLKINNRLRGCIGHIYPVEPLEQAVISNAINAASQDPRFPPVKSEELKLITIEISALTKPRKIDSLKEFIIGRHGIILKKGYHQAVYLPQVASEQGWDKATTLSHLSRKAGLTSNAWRKGTDFFVFEAQIFHENSDRTP